MQGKRAWLRAGVIAGTAVAACQFDHGSAPTQQPQRDSGVVDIAIDGPSVCMSTFTSCMDAVTLLDCQIGSAAKTTRCGWGCTGSAPAAKCAALQPGGGAVLTADTDGSSFGSDLGMIDLGSNLIVDGDTGEIGLSGMTSSVRGSGSGVINMIDYELRAGSSVAVFRFKSLTVSGPITLVSRFQHRAIVFVADGDITISDVIDARGFCGGSDAGPGGFPGGAKNTAAAGSGGGSATSTNEIGGGGGGCGGTGGSGNGNGGTTTAGGSAYGSASIMVLVGGGGGGGGGGNGGPGGGGGGALQVISNSKIVFAAAGSASGINAGGCGGVNGMAGNDGGGGGGAGGTIFLEAPIINLGGTLAVNGGAGGTGASGNTNASTPGLLSRSPAVASSAAGALGGAGAAGSNTDGTIGGNAGNHGGAGGGAIGRIRIETRNGSGFTLGGGAVLSPSGSDNSTYAEGSAVVQ